MHPVSNLKAELNGCLCIVDSAIFVHKFAYSAIDGNIGAVGDRFVEMNKHLRLLGARPLFVFDGKRLPEKAATSAKRCKARNSAIMNSMANSRLNEGCETIAKNDINVDNLATTTNDKWFCDWLNKKTRDQKEARKISPPSRDDFIHIMQRLATESIPYMIAENEAERDCALISQTLAPSNSLVITQDMDALVFGAPRVLRDVTLSCLADGDSSLAEGPVSLGQPFIVDLKMLLATLNMTMPQFIDACILCGCDFTTTRIKGFGPVKAFREIRDGKTIEECLPSPRPGDFEFESARAVFTMPSMISCAQVIVGSENYPLNEWFLNKTFA